MVVLDSVPGLDVQVHVSGKPAEEFANDDEQDDRRGATRYVEAVSGAEFHVQWTFVASEFKYRNWAINGLVYIDGKYADGRIFRPETVKHLESFTVKMTGVWKKEKGRYVERPMIFSDLMIGMLHPSSASPRMRFPCDGMSDFRLYADEAGQSAAIKGLKEKLDLLGEISVRFYRGRAVPAVGEGSRKSFSTIDKVPEKALKGRAVSHQARCVPRVLTAGVPNADMHKFGEIKSQHRVDDVGFRVRRLRGRQEASICNIYLQVSVKKSTPGRVHYSEVTNARAVGGAAHRRVDTGGVTRARSATKGKEIYLVLEIST